jgi:hypothetical protein
VLTVTAVAPTFGEARRLSREAAEAIVFEGKIYRPDIGWREAERMMDGGRGTVDGGRRIVDEELRTQRL